MMLRRIMRLYSGSLSVKKRSYSFQTWLTQCISLKIPLEMFFLQQDGFLDKVITPVTYLEERDRPINQTVHAVLAARIGRIENAHELYLQTARLDLEDYSNDTEDGLHITSMVGSWLSIVYGFAGMQMKNGVLTFHPQIPA